MSANALATRMGIAQSACQSILQALESEEFVRRDPATLRYAVGVGLVTVASRLLSSGVSLTTVQEELDKISSTFAVTAVANEIDKESATVIGLAFGGAMLGARLSIGRHVSAWVGASGRCFAAHSGLGREELVEKFGRLKFSVPLQFDQWFDQVERTRREGIGTDEGYFVRGYTNLAAPIFEGEYMRRSIVAVFASKQLSDSERGSLTTYLLQVSKRLST